MSDGDAGLSGKVSITVFAKALFLIAVTAAVVAVSVALYSLSIITSVVSDKLAEKAAVATESMASDFGAPLRFKKYENITDVLDTRLQLDADTFVGGVVLSSDLEVVVTAGALGDAAMPHLRSLASASGVVSHVSSDSLQYMVVAPIMVGAENTLVGYLATEWTASVELALLRDQKRRGWLVAIGIFFGFLAFSALLLRQWITRPIMAVTEAMAKISDGHLDIDVPYQNARDEVSRMAQALNTQKMLLIAAREENEKARAADENAKQIAEQIAQKEQEQRLVVDQLRQALQRLSEGDLTVRIERDFGSDYKALQSDFNQALEGLQDTLSIVDQKTGSIQGQSAEIKASSDELSRRTEEQAATLAQASAALGELTGSVSSSADSANEVKSIVMAAKTDAENSQDVVRNAVDAMTEIDSSSSQIGQIITVIEEIAFQTNLLALNAGVEAARAGEAGRGFAVVATEVRALAQRSSEAATEINALIDRANMQVAKGSTLVKQSGAVLTQVLEQVSGISKHVTEIAEQAQEQSVGLSEVNEGISQLDLVTQQNAAVAQQATAASYMLQTDASTLSDLVKKFETDPGDKGYLDASEIGQKQIA